MWNIDLNRVLWLTRGEKWDYGFVLTPTYPQTDRWFDFHAKVFPENRTEATPLHLGGFLYLGNEQKIPFLSTMFSDLELVDAVGRPIQHYLTWFPTAEFTVYQKVEVATDWGVQLVGAFDKAWASAYAGDNAPAGELFLEERRRLGELELASGYPALVGLDRMISVRHPTKDEGGVGGQPVNDQTNSVADERPDVQSDPHVAISQAILEGEAWAVGSESRLGGMGVSVHAFMNGLKALGSSSCDERVAESFDGAIGDKFIQRRVKKIHRRVSRGFQNLPSKPRRGFTALSEALEPLVKETEELALKKEIASLINASEQDRVVHQLTQRILNLQKKPDVPSRK